MFSTDSLACAAISSCIKPAIAFALAFFIKDRDNLSIALADSSVSLPFSSIFIFKSSNSSLAFLTNSFLSSRDILESSNALFKTISLVEFSPKVLLNAFDSCFAFLVPPAKKSKADITVVIAKTIPRGPIIAAHISFSASLRLPADFIVKPI